MTDLQKIDRSTNFATRFQNAALFAQAAKAPDIVDTPEDIQLKQQAEKAADSEMNAYRQATRNYFTVIDILREKYQKGKYLNQFDAKAHANKDEEDLIDDLGDKMIKALQKVVQKLAQFFIDQNKGYYYKEENPNAPGASDYPSDKMRTGKIVNKNVFYFAQFKAHELKNEVEGKYNHDLKPLI
jgi:hypothetical protein